MNDKPHPVRTVHGVLLHANGYHDLKPGMVVAVRRSFQGSSWPLDAYVDVTIEEVGPLEMSFISPGKTTHVAHARGYDANGDTYLLAYKEEGYPPGHRWHYTGGSSQSEASIALDILRLIYPDVPSYNHLDPAWRDWDRDHPGVFEAVKKRLTKALSSRLP